ncbi:MAG: hypothetical protein LBB18_01600 [Puniceicoccales bacterium]|jgi:hypothetical protein|nr:hypothetical protein [Puniceicoccales bacterium]
MVSVRVVIFTISFLVMAVDGFSAQRGPFRHGRKIEARGSYPIVSASRVGAGKMLGSSSKKFLSLEQKLCGKNFDRAGPRRGVRRLTEAQHRRPHFKNFGTPVSIPSTKKMSLR